MSRSRQKHIRIERLSLTGSKDSFPTLLSPSSRNNPPELQTLRTLLQSPSPVDHGPRELVSPSTSSPLPETTRPFTPSLINSTSLPPVWPVPPLHPLVPAPAQP